MLAGQLNFSFSGVGVCTLKRFSELSGLSEGVVLGWQKKGYLPTKSIGKYTLVNLVAFNQQLIEQENLFISDINDRG